MKKIILLLLFAIPIISFAQNQKATWDYPVKPGSKEWLKVDDYSKRLQLLNVPEDILLKLNTKELVQICLKYPQMELIFTRNDILSGISYVSTLFNGFIELSKRKDAGTELLRIYKDLNPDNYATANLKEKISHKKNFIVMELLLASPVILRNMEKEERVDLLNVLYNKYEEKAKYWQQFYYDQISSNLLVMAQILKLDKSSTIDDIEYNKKVDILLRSGEINDPEFVSIFTKNVANYLGK